MKKTCTCHVGCSPETSLQFSAPGCNGCHGCNGPAPWYARSVVHVPLLGYAFRPPRSRVPEWHGMETLEPRLLLSGVDQNGTLDDAEAVSTLPASISGMIGCDDGQADICGDVDFYTVDASAGQRLIVQSSCSCTFLRVFDENGDVCACSDPNSAGYPRVNFVTSEQTYYIGVSGYDNTSYDPTDTTGRDGAEDIGYTLNVLVDLDGTRAAACDLGAPCSSCATLGCGEIGTDDGCYYFSDDVDFYSVTAEAGQRVIFDCVPCSCGSPTPVLHLYSPGGSELSGTCGSDSCGGTWAAFTAVSAGDYYVAISGASESTGPYRVDVYSDEDGSPTWSTCVAVAAEPDVVLSGAYACGSGDTYTVGVAFNLPEEDTLAAWSIDWGDGTCSCGTSSITCATHTYDTSDTGEPCYFYAITATATGSGTTPATYDSNALLVTIYADPATAPSNLSVGIDPVTGDYQLTWSAITGAWGYIVCRVGETGTPSPVGGVVGTSFTDVGSGTSTVPLHYAVVEYGVTPSPDPSPNPTPQSTPPGPPQDVTLLYCYGLDAVGFARNDALLAWDPVPGVTGYEVYCDASALASVAATADCYIAATPLGHTYTVTAINGAGESSASYGAQLVSNNPYFDSCDVEDESKAEAVIDLAGDGDRYDSIQVDPEVDGSCNVYGEYEVGTGYVEVGTTDGPWDPEDPPAWKDMETFYGCGSSGDGTFYYSINASYSSSSCDPCAGGPTFFTVVMHSDTCDEEVWSTSCAYANVNLKGIEPYWITVGIGAPGGGMSRNDDGTWENTLGRYTLTSGVADVDGRNGDMDGDWIPDFADGYNLNQQQGDADDSSMPTQNSNGTDPGLRPFCITCPNLPAGAVIHITYDASDPMDVSRTGSGTPQDPYVYSLPNDGQNGLRLWITNSGSRDGRTVQEGGDFLPEGDYTVTTGDAMCTPVEVGSRTIDMGNLYLEFVGSSIGNCQVGVSADFSPSPEAESVHLEANSVPVELWNKPEIILMPGCWNKGATAMTAIGQQIQDQLFLHDPVLSGGIGISVLSVPNSATADLIYDGVKAQAQHNWLANLGYFAQRCPIILVGYSDGATCVRNFANTLRTDCPDAKIDFVGMIDLARKTIGSLDWPLIDWGSCIDMPNNITSGLNFYERSWERHKLGTFPPWNGHEVRVFDTSVPPKLVRHPTILNYNMTDDMTFVYHHQGRHPNHEDMPYIPEVQDEIARRAAWSYVNALHLLNTLGYGTGA